MPTLIKNGKNYSGTSVSLTQAEYDALTETQKNDGTVYFITDSDAVLDASDVSVGSGTVEDSIGSIAVIETSPATFAHAVGTYLVYNGKLYKVTSAIAVGETLTVGTNISATTVGNELSEDVTSQVTALNGGCYRALIICGKVAVISIYCNANVSAWSKLIRLPFNMGNDTDGVLMQSDGTAIPVYCNVGNSEFGLRGVATTGYANGTVVGFIR